MRSTRRSHGRPLAFLPALLVGGVTQAAALAAFARDPSSTFLGVPGALGIVIGLVTGVLAGPLAGVLVALVGSVGFVVVVGDGRPTATVAVALWAVVAWIAGSVADRYRNVGRDRDVAHESERRARQAAESESERLALLQRLTGRLATALSVRDVSQALIDTVLRSLGATAAVVTLRSADRDGLDVVAARGYPTEIVDRWRRNPPEAPGIVRDATERGSVIILESAIDAFERYPSLRTVGPGYPLGAQAAAPLVAGDQGLGAVGISFPHTRRFSSEDEALLVAIGRQCGQAIERARLYDAERRARERATQLRELASALAAAARPAEIAEIGDERVFPMLNARAGTIAAVAADGRAVELVGANGFAQAGTGIVPSSAPPVAEVIAGGEPVLLGSPEAMRERYAELAEGWAAVGDRAWACVPLKASGRVAGVLCVDYDEPQAFDERQRDDLRAVGDQIALALERSLLQEAREQAARLSARVERVKGVTGAMSSGLGLGEVAEAVLREATDALGAAAGGICVATDAGDELVVISRRGVEQHVPDRVAIDVDDPVAEAYRTRTPVLVTEPAGRSSLLGGPVGALIAIPISEAGRRVGAIGLRFDRHRSLSQEEVAFVEALAEEAGEALERARLFEAEQRALRRSARLQEVTARLARAVTTEDAARAILRGATAGVGAAAATIALANDEAASLRAITGVMSGGTLTLNPPLELPLGARAALANVYRQGHALWIASHEEWERRFDEDFALQRDLGRCMYAVPIVAKGEAIGALAVYFGDRRPQLSSDDAELIRAFAHQAGVALERARTYEVEHEAAMTLQRNLMPEGFSHRTNVEANGRYLPATRGVQVGGDWYDIVDRPDGTVAFAVGDIAGHGLQAAAAMGQVRSAWRALALSASDPSAILGSLDRFAAGVEGAFFSTILAMVLDPTTNELRYASAGHPPALAIEPGATRFLDAGRSVPLGLPFDLPRPQASERLPRGSVLVLYTDGLIERRDESLDQGLARLTAVAATVAGRPLAEISEALIALVSDDRHDDVALLAIGPSARADVFRRSFPADASELAPLRAELRTWLERSEAPWDTREDLVLACSEAASNAIEHAYIGRGGDVHVVVEAEDGWLRASVSDEGRWRDPRPDDARGRGLELVRALIDEIDIERDAGGTTVRMRVGSGS